MFADSASNFPGAFLCTNSGQTPEVASGVVGKKSGAKPVIQAPDGVYPDDSNERIDKVGSLCHRLMYSHDGEMGECPDQFVIAGTIHPSKSGYTAEDKTYVWLTGFHLSTIQQLSGGKVQPGGQCPGETEARVPEVPGVLYASQETSIAKLDDIAGWLKIHELTAKGDNTFMFGTFELSNASSYESWGSGSSTKPDQLH